VSGNPYPVHAETLGLSNKIYHVLQRMRADSGDVHESRMESGRVNVLDFATRKPWEMDFFDHHEEGRADEFDMEVVILLDLSPSMIGMASTASSALWQIKHAMSRFGVRVTAYGYNDGKAKCLYGPGDGTSSTRFESFQAGGSGTDPLDALTRAYNILSRTDSHRRVLFTITDGEWNYNVRHQCDAIVEKINGLRNATTILVGLESSYISSASGVIRHDDRSTYHCHHIARSVDEPAKIVDIFKDFVYHVARQR
jgi:Mg-chelatase subunit ChlD